MHTHIRTYRQCICIYILNTYTHACIHTKYIQICIHTMNMHTHTDQQSKRPGIAYALACTYIYTCIHTYTYIWTCIHTYWPTKQTPRHRICTSFSSSERQPFLFRASISTRNCIMYICVYVYMHKLLFIGEAAISFQSLHINEKLYYVYMCLCIYAWASLHRRGSHFFSGPLYRRTTVLCIYKCVCVYMHVYACVCV
jgi:hypothetical protein